MVFFYRSLIALLFILPLLTNGQEQMHSSSSLPDIVSSLLNREVKKTESMKIFTTSKIDGTAAETELNRKRRLVGGDDDGHHPTIALDVDDGHHPTIALDVDDGHDPTIALDPVTTTTPVSTTSKNDIKTTTIPATAATTNPKFSSAATTPKSNDATSTSTTTTSETPNSAAAQGLSMILFGLVGFFLI